VFIPDIVFPPASSSVTLVFIPDIVAKRVTLTGAVTHKWGMKISGCISVLIQDMHVFTVEHW